MTVTLGRGTTGGTFDPSKRPIYFAAAGAQLSAFKRTRNGRSLPKHILLAVNDLQTAAQEKVMAELLDNGWIVLLDSGIFWLTNEHKRATGCTMDQALALPPEKVRGFDELFARYVELVNRYSHQLWGYIELDQGGRDNKIKTRAKLHDIGLDPMPVYHPLNDGWDYFDELAADYDRMCMGNVVQAHHAARLRMMHTLWERHCAHPDLWVHVLGLSAGPACLPCPPDSCDSSTWVAGFRWKICTESAMLRPLGQMDDTWHYSTADNLDDGVHMQNYAQTMDHMNSMWGDVEARHTALGVPMYPRQPPVARPA